MQAVTAREDERVGLWAEGVGGWWWCSRDRAAGPGRWMGGIRSLTDKANGNK